MATPLPNLDPKTCPSCRLAPCRALAQAFTNSVVLVGPNEVSKNCPLKVSVSSLPRYSGDLRRFTLTQVLSKVGHQPSFSTSGFRPDTPPGVAILALLRQGKIALVAAPYGSPARKQLDAWKGATLASSRKAMEEKAAEEAAEVEKEKPKPALVNPSWVRLEKPKSPEGKEDTLTCAAPSDSVWCKVETQGMMPGDSILFTVFLKGEKGAADMKLTSIAGRVGENRKDDSAVSKWMVESVIHGNPVTMEKDRFLFIAKCSAHNLELKGQELTVVPLEVDGIEVPDVLFAHNSALPLLCAPDERDEDGFSSLNHYAQALVYGAENPDLAILIYGHTDTSGGEAYNLELSRLRAEAVKALLDGDENAFTKVAKQKSGDETLSAYMDSFHKALRWDTAATQSEGQPDGQGSDENPAGASGPISRTVIRNFQAAYNADFEGNLHVDGAMGTETWGAIFKVLRQQIGMLVEAKGGDPKQAKPRFVSEGGGIEACGEEYPIEAKEKDGFRSQKNRRVEIAFIPEAKPKPQVRKHVHVKPLPPKIEKVDRPPASVTSIDFWCGHEHEKRKAKNGEVLEVVAATVGGDAITLRAQGEGAKDLVWEAPGLFDGKKTGAEIKFTVHGFRSNPVTWWFPDVLPQKYQLNVTAPGGKTLSCSIWNYPNDERTVEIDAWKAGKIIHDAVKKIAWVLKEEDEKHFEFLQGKVRGKTGFKEDAEFDEFPTKVLFGYSIEAAFSPLIKCSLKVKYPTPISAIPQMIKKYTADIDAYLELGGAISCTFSFLKESNKGKKFKGKGGGAIEIAIGLEANVGASKILKVDGKGVSGFEVEVTHKEEDGKKSISEKLILEIEPMWSGLTASILFDLWDGTVSYSRKVTLLDPHKFEKIEWELIGD